MNSQNHPKLPSWAKSHSEEKLIGTDSTLARTQARDTNYKVQIKVDEVNRQSQISERNSL